MVACYRCSLTTYRIHVLKLEIRLIQDDAMTRQSYDRFQETLLHQDIVNYSPFMKERNKYHQYRIPMKY